MPMSEPKPLASLSANLLARKGEARPAIRRAYVPLVPGAPAREDDKPAAPAPVSPKLQQEWISQAFAPLSKARLMPVAMPRTAKAAFTLRLDPERHLRLRLVSAVKNRSAQQIVTEALDAFLKAQPGLDALVAQAGEPNQPAAIP